MRTTAPGPPGRRDVRAWTERTERILGQAAESVLASGYSGTTIEAVARGAGVAKGTIYLHFAGRDALFAAVLRRDADVLGTLAHAQPVPEIPGTARGFATYLDELRALGLVRTDLPTAELLAAVAAILLGFLTTGALLPVEVPRDRLPGLVAGTVARALDRGAPLTTSDAARTAQLTTAYLDTAVDQAAAAYRLAAGIEKKEPA